MFTDTHCHLYKEYYSDISNVINKSIKEGVSLFINNGVDSKTNIEVIDLVSKYKCIYGALGIHPEAVNNYQDEDIKYIEDNLSNPKIIAIGEIGLDYHYGIDNKEEQIILLRRQLDLAQKHNKPVIIHSRDANDDMLNILNNYNITGVIHSFSGDLDIAQKFIKKGFLIGINGIITFHNSNLSSVVKELPLESILLETDSPYLSPVPYRGSQNYPGNVLEIAKYISKLKNISLEELSNITNNNVKKMFNVES